MAKNIPSFQVARQADGTWAPAETDAGGHVMHLNVYAIEQLLREHAENYQSRVAGLLACESISRMELSGDGTIKVTIES